MYSESKTFRIPGELQENKKAPIVWQLGYDVSHEARFEALRNPGRYRAVYRSHRNITKVTEKKIRSYDRGQKMFNNELKWCAHKVVKKLQHLRDRTENVNNTLKVKYSYNPGENQDKDKNRKTKNNSDIVNDAELSRDNKKGMANAFLTRSNRENPAVVARVLPVQKLTIQKDMTLKLST